MLLWGRQSRTLQSPCPTARGAQTVVALGQSETQAERINTVIWW